MSEVATVADGLPGTPTPYMIEAGAGRRYVGRASLSRVMASGLETRGEMSVTTLMFAPGGEIPPHFHEPRIQEMDYKPTPTAATQHDLMMCIAGRMQFWTDGECRILRPGDAVNIPPGTVHAARALGLPTMMLSPVIPPGWIRFFDLMAKPWDPEDPELGVTGAPDGGPRSAAAGPRYDLVVKENLLHPVEYDYPEPRFDAADDTLPSGVETYFLRAGCGPRHALFGHECVQICTGVQSGGRTAMTVTEGSLGASMPTHVHEHSYEGIFCLTGRLAVVTDGVRHELCEGDFVSVPQGTEHAYTMEAHCTRFVTMTATAGPERLFELAGTAVGPSPQASVATPDPDRLAEIATETDTVFV